MAIETTPWTKFTTVSSVGTSSGVPWYDIYEAFALGGAPPSTGYHNMPFVADPSGATGVWAPYIQAVYNIEAWYTAVPLEFRSTKNAAALSIPAGSTIKSVEFRSKIAKGRAGGGVIDQYYFVGSKFGSTWVGSFSGPTEPPDLYMYPVGVGAGPGIVDPASATTRTISHSYTPGDLAGRTTDDILTNIYAELNPTYYTNEGETGAPPINTAHVFSPEFRVTYETGGGGPVDPDPPASGNTQHTTWF